MVKADNDVDKLHKSSAKLGIDDLVSLLNSPKRLTWLNFYTGFLRGVGSVLGAAITLVIVGLMVQYLGGIPWLGDLLSKIGQAAKVK